MKQIVKVLTQWAWQEELVQLKELIDERDDMLVGLERCGKPVRLRDLPDYCYNMSNYCEKLSKELRLLKDINK